MISDSGNGQKLKFPRPFSSLGRNIWRLLPGTPADWGLRKRWLQGIVWTYHIFRRTGSHLLSTAENSCNYHLCLIQDLSLNLNHIVGFQTQSGEKDASDDFVMRALGAIHHARFLGWALYMKISMLADVIPPFQAIQKKINRMAQYITFFMCLGPFRVDWLLQLQV